MRVWIGMVRSLLLLLALALPLLVRPAIIGGDEPHYSTMAWSIAFDGDLRLENDYDAVEQGQSPAAGTRNLGKKLDRHLLPRAAGMVTSHPIGLPLLAAPFLRIAAEIGIGGLPDSILLGMTVATTAAGFLALVSLVGTWLADERVGRIVAGLTFFSSPLWYYGRTFFTEPYLWCLLASSVWLLTRGRPLGAGFLLGAAILVKDPALVLVFPILAGALWFRGLRFALFASAGPCLGVVGFFARNLLLYGSGPISFFQPFQRGDLGRGLLGTLVDSRHGLLPFFPLALLAVAGLLRARGGADRRLALLAGAGIAAQVALVASWADWTGGSCYGPRLLLPVLPAFAVGLGLAWKAWSASRAFRGLFVVLSAVGIGVQAAAVTNPFRAFWSIAIDDLIVGNRSALAVAIVAAGACAWWLQRSIRPS